MAVDVFKLCVPVRMAGPLDGLAVRLKAVVKIVEQLANKLMRNLMALTPQLPRELAHTLASPTQGRLRIATCGRLHQSLQIGHQGGILLDCSLPSSSRLADVLVAASWAGRFTQLLHSSSDRLSR